VQVVTDGAPCDGLRPTGRALIARLALAPGQVVSLQHLVDDLWGDELPSNPAGALRVVVTRSRASIGVSADLAWEQGGYVLRGDAPVEVDAVAFRRLVEQARTADPAQAATVLRDALALWRGDALADVRFAPFAAVHAAHLHGERRTVLDQRIAADLACGRHAELLGELAALAREHPMQERVWAHWMLALYRAGRQAKALRVYAQLRATLAEEVGLDPSPELRDLEQAILEQRAELSWNPPAEAPPRHPTTA
jgi:DNA-binding SARP family transcriptional activator